MHDDEVMYLMYVDNPDWHGSASPSDWRHFISDELRTLWPTFTYHQKWAIAQNAGNIGHGLAVLMAGDDLEARRVRPGPQTACIRAGRRRF